MRSSFQEVGGPTSAPLRKLNGTTPSTEPLVTANVTISTQPSFDTLSSNTRSIGPFYPDGQTRAITTTTVADGAPTDEGEEQNEEGKECEQGDDNIVGWDGPNDPSNPFNWPTWRKVVNLTLIAVLAFIMNLASSMFAPRVPQLMQEFHSNSSVLSGLVVSVYLLGFALGPLIIAPMSEIYGRAIVYHVTNICYVAITAGCALAPTLNTLIGLRVIAGFFGSCTSSNASGSIADMVTQERRALVSSIVGTAPLIGPIVGPIIGGFLASAKGWRWTFWLVVIVAGFLTVTMLVFLRESYAPVILQRKVRRLQKAHGNEDLRSKLDSGLTEAQYFQRAIIRPLKMLVFSPIVSVLAFYVAVSYGYLYLVFTTITQVFEEYYNFPANLVGLAYIGLGVGSVVGVIVFSKSSDGAVKKAKQANNGKPVKPELRLRLLPLGATCLPIGLFIYGWTAQYRTQWIAPIIGMVVIGFANLISSAVINLYLVDTFTTYAASSLAATTVVKSIGGALLPLAGLSMYNALGVGWGNSLLGFVATALIPVPFLIRHYGQRLRESFDFRRL